MGKKQAWVCYGKWKIQYDVHFVDRKTLEIAVHPDERVEVKAPLNTTQKEIQKKVNKRARWIRRKILYFKQFHPRTPARQYVGGETHLYLGRQYRLKIKKLKKESVNFSGAYLQMFVNDRHDRVRIKELLEQWYFQKAQINFDSCFKHCENFFDKQLLSPKFKIKRMKARWGSLSPQKKLTLNVDLIKYPKECIEYVIAHELCHLKFFNHGSAYYRLLEKIMPDWKKRKARLEQIAI
ncbi:MAG: M48 family metallopeptidase [Candidatus Omnitrophica bacterium]|nr:M48 family metallopeptidase [Candidatus Omnitrophota bacterium]